MKSKAFLASIALLTLLVSCGDELSSNHKQGTPVSDRPSIETGETVAVASYLHRERGAAVLTSFEEIAQIISNDLPTASYRTIPLMEKDDEGSAVNVTTRGNLGRPDIACGLGPDFAGIDSRINDCFQKNAEKSQWEGFRYGASGESTWKLVSRSESGTEIWLDNRTGMVWSDIVATANWCKASGNDDLPAGTTTINCNDLMAQTRTCQDLFIEGMGSVIIWRLPTRGDFLQADLDGSRFVLKPENASGLWTATMRAASTGRSEAWIYNSIDGTLTAGNLTTERQVRCIGAPIR
ncbi:MAG: hypothetical protein NDI69_07085 [Bacteriovoracaceae bacterium]|nr:hypothetical protein [Bacteriovoracaceae bacterium]